MHDSLAEVLPESLLQNKTKILFRISGQSRSSPKGVWVQGEGTEIPCFYDIAVKDVCDHCYCASLRRTQIHVMHWARALSTKIPGTMIGQMAIAIALLGFNDLGRSVTPTFLFRDRFYLQLSPRCPKMNKNQGGKSTRHGIHLAAARRVKLWWLNANLFFKEPQQVSKFS